jgi:hypothetical protein
VGQWCKKSTVRFVIDEIAANQKDFQHRLQGYNNSRVTTFDDIQKDRVELRSDRRVIRQFVYRELSASRAQKDSRPIARMPSDVLAQRPMYPFSAL